MKGKREKVNTGPERYMGSELSSLEISICLYSFIQHVFKKHLLSSRGSKRSSKSREQNRQNLYPQAACVAVDGDRHRWNGHWGGGYCAGKGEAPRMGWDAR